MTSFVAPLAVFAASLLFVAGAFRTIAHRTTLTGRHKNALRLKLGGGLLMVGGLTMIFALSGWVQLHPSFYNESLSSAPYMKFVLTAVVTTFVGFLVAWRGHHTSSVEEKLRRRRQRRLRAMHKYDRDGVRRLGAVVLRAVQ